MCSAHDLFTPRPFIRIRAICPRRRTCQETSRGSKQQDDPRTGASLEAIDGESKKRGQKRKKVASHRFERVFQDGAVHLKSMSECSREEEAGRWDAATWSRLCSLAWFLKQNSITGHMSLSTGIKRWASPVGRSRPAIQKKEMKKDMSSSLSTDCNRKRGKRGHTRASRLWRWLIQATAHDSDDIQLIGEAPRLLLRGCHLFLEAMRNQPRRACVPAQ